MWLRGSAHLGFLLTLIVSAWCTKGVAHRKNLDDLQTTARKLLEHPKFSTLSTETQQGIHNIAHSATRTKYTTQQTGTSTLPLRQSRYHTVIIGAGISGLTAAHELVTSTINPVNGNEVLIVESRNRVGGRVVNIPLKSKPGVVVEGGGTWIGPTQSEVKKLADQFSLKTFSTYYRPELTPDLLVSASTKPYVDALNKLAQTIPLDTPWTATDAAKYDAMVFEKWVNDTVPSSNPVARTELLQSTGVSLGGTAREISFLFYLWFLRSTGSFQLYNGLRGGAQDTRFVDGSQALPLAMETKLRGLGVTFFFNTKITDIRQSENVNNADLLIPLTTRNLTVVASHVVIAMGSGDRQFVKFTPPLSTDHQEWSKNWPLGDGTKAFLVYDTPFWRSAPFLRDVPMILAGGIPVFDYSPYNTDKSGGPGVLLGFLGSEGGNGANAAKEREQVLRAAVTLEFGTTAPTDREYVEQYWGPDSGTWNCVGFTKPNVLMTRGATGWRSAAGRKKNIYFAGSDTSSVWIGYMDGAVRSATRVVNEIKSNVLVANTPTPPTSPSVPSTPTVPTVTPPTTATEDDDASELAGGQIAGLVIGLISGFLLLAVGLVLFMLRKKKNKRNKYKTKNAPQVPYTSHPPAGTTLRAATPPAEGFGLGAYPDNGGYSYLNYDGYNNNVMVDPYDNLGAQPGYGGYL